MMELEICVDSVESAIAAQEGGAHRVELCSALSEGGLTPSAGLMRAVRAAVTIGVHAMIRPRGGDFFYSTDEYGIMQDDVAYALQCGVDGVVLGLLTADGRVDVERTAALVKMARPMFVTFHRALDMARDVRNALEDVIDSGADRILTSGAEPTALIGSECLRDLVEVAGDRVRIMAGGGVRPQNVRQVALATGVSAFHAALRTAVPSPATYQNRKLSMGDQGRDEYARYVVLAKDVRELREAMDGVFETKGTTA